MYKSEDKEQIRMTLDHDQTMSVDFDRMLATACADTPTHAESKASSGSSPFSFSGADHEADRSFNEGDLDNLLNEVNSVLEVK